LRPKICVNILGNIYNKTKNINNNINSILFINKWINKIIESNVETVSMILHQSCAEELGIIIISCTVYI